jgi:arginyl-tRNA synthetase
VKEKIVSLIVKAMKRKGLSRKEIEVILEVPPHSDLGDYAFPCFKLTQIYKSNPNSIAEELRARITKPKWLERIVVKGPYLNFFLNYPLLAQKLLPQIIKEKEKFGKNKNGKGKKVMVEYSAPNTNKPLTLGHLRNDSIGMALSNLFEANGWKVIRANLYSNRGIHICKSMLGYMKWGNDALPNKKPDHFVGDFYVLFSKKANQNPELEKEALEVLNKWEQKDKKVRTLWKKMDSWVIKGFKQTYKEFGSKFDVEFKESDFFQKSTPIIKKGRRAKAHIPYTKGTSRISEADGAAWRSHSRATKSNKRMLKEPLIIKVKNITR